MSGWEESVRKQTAKFNTVHFIEIQFFDFTERRGDRVNESKFNETNTFKMLPIYTLTTPKINEISTNHNFLALSLSS